MLNQDYSPLKDIHSYMLTTAKLKIVHDLVSNSTHEELIWLNGYITGFVTRNHAALTAQPAADNQAGKINKITILYGTETGNSKKLAGEFALAAKQKGIAAKVVSADQYKLTDLAKEQYLFVIISTHGEGEPPIAAKTFYEYLHQQPLQLPGLGFGVLALGDTAYPLFCKTGEDVDARLSAAGAKRLVPLQKLDVDFDTEPASWFQQVFTVLQQQKAPATRTVEATPAKKTGKQYYEGTITTNINLNDRGSAKSTHHIEISVPHAVAYEPGDSLAIVPQNRADVVQEIIRLANIDAGLEVSTSKFNDTVATLLTQHLNICYLLTSTIKKYAAITGHDIPDTRMDLRDLLKIYPVKDAAQFVEVIKVLSPIAPRLYSIASSPSAHTDEIHLTVGRNIFLVQDEQRYGLCSDFLGDLPKGTRISFYIHKNRAFRLPAADKDIIMIGPGTGIAPFRSFLNERDVTAATGKNWLFFGEQHFVTDFLYQVEIQQWLATGVLSRLDLAFSRDQPQKVYVQHQLEKNAAALKEWISNGAYIYISGNKKMGADVETALQQILGADALKALQTNDRFQKDIY